MLRKPEDRDPRGYIIPFRSGRFPDGDKVCQRAHQNRITVTRATASFQVSGKTYPANSYVIKSAQAFRPHIIDMF
jgi:hypothetical protein